MSRFGIIPASAFDADLKPAQIALLSLLSTYADKSGYCWPSRETLADKLNMSPAWVTSNMQELQRSGFVKITRHKGRKYGFFINYDTKSYRQHTDLNSQNTDLNGQRADTNNTINNNKKRKGQKTSIPKDFKLEPQTIKYCTEKFPEINLSEFIEHFVLQCQSHDYRYVDWQATFKNWIRRSEKQGKSNVTKFKTKPRLRDINDTFDQCLRDIK